MLDDFNVRTALLRHLQNKKLSASLHTKIDAPFEPEGGDDIGGLRSLSLTEDATQRHVEADAALTARAPIKTQARGDN
jgi:hypothetical protein